MVASAGMVQILRDLAAGTGSTWIGGNPQESAQVLGVDGVAVSLLSDGVLSEVVWSCPGVSTRLEDLQFTLGQGPGIDAARGCSLVLEPDLARVRESRWPMLLSAAVEMGIGAVFCFPLRIGGACLGVLTVQRAVAGPLSSSVMDDALILAAAVTAVVLDRGERMQAFAVAESASHLHRAVVHQAAGMISVQARVPIAEALLLLRAYAYGRDRPLLEVAQDVVARRLHFRDNGNGPDPYAGKRG